ncbi:hypothetical protein GOP47_0019965 [Adiantum capillus-veneris]|uniref:Uncharacterized protein n=1 Tax=Adiantum capillus-veneris TaxID=13818 RepID=A0A9D4UCB3_ADICA|nr:hypothetical protein GOP47_0019965 [Adiantum capillus-veneris]
MVLSGMAVAEPSLLSFRKLSLHASHGSLQLESPPPNRSMSLIKQPMEGLKNMAGRYKQAVILQIEGFWRRNLLILVGVAGILACYLLWRIMYGVAGIFVSFSERMAKFGLLAWLPQLWPSW